MIPKFKDIWMLYRKAHVWTLVEKSIEFDGYMLMRCWKNPPSFLALNKIVLRPLKDVTIKEMTQILHHLSPEQDYHIFVTKITDGYDDPYGNTIVSTKKIVGEVMCEIDGEEMPHSLIILDPKEPTLPISYMIYDPLKSKFKDTTVLNYPSLTLYMISRYFDLWGHIDRLEAMDSTFLTPDPYHNLKK